MSQTEADTSRRTVAVGILLLLYAGGIAFVYVGNADAGAYLYGLGVGLATVLLTNWAYGLPIGPSLLRRGSR